MNHNLSLLDYCFESMPVKSNNEKQGYVLVTACPTRT